jgi:hypothetical protein
MRCTSALSSAGRHFLVPKAVWSPAGAFWGSSTAPGANPQQNAFLGGLLFLTLGLSLASYGAGLEVGSYIVAYNLQWEKWERCCVCILCCLFLFMLTLPLPSLILLLSGSSNTY